jgi:hypothetical protein
MVPYFGGSIKQNLNENVHNTILEKYTGFDDPIKLEKTEQVCFTDYVQNHYDNNTMTSYINEYDRIQKPVFHNNILPTEQIKVGPGTKYTDPANPSGGFQQSDFRDINYYKNVDQLRVKTNPKESYEGRVIHGHKELTRAKKPNLKKNKINTYYDNKHILSNKSEYTKPSIRSCEYVKPTNRKDTTTEYTGILHTNIGNVNEGKVKKPFKKTLGSYGNRNTDFSKFGTGDKYDFGKKNILIYANERDITSTQTYQGNLTSYVKSIIAPVIDVIKPTNKVYHVAHPRPMGNLQTSYPKKQALHDPNDTAKTTVKETLIHDQRTGNLKSFEQITTYDPNHIARTTIKETNINNNRDGNIKSYNKTVVYDPSEEIKTTIRETLDNSDSTVNFSGNKKSTIYDPNDIAKTTIKETNIENDHFGNMDVIDTLPGAYISTDYDAKITNKQFTSDNEHYGQAEQQNADAYKNTKIELDITNKQILSDNEYYGTPDTGEYDAMMSYENIYNAVINKSKENTLKSRKPTGSSVKISSGSDKLHLTTEKLICNNNQNYSIDKVYQNIPSINNVNLTHGPHTHPSCVNDRLTPDLLKPFHNNPYTKPLDVVV